MHYGFLTIKRTAACLGCGKDVTGEDVGEWLWVSSVYTADIIMWQRHCLMLHSSALIMCSLLCDVEHLIDSSNYIKNTIISFCEIFI